MSLPLKDIRVVSFDADQTLLNFRRLLVECLQKSADFLTAETGQNVAWQDLQLVRDQILERHHGRIINLLTIRRLAFEAYLSGSDNADRLVEGAMQVFVTHRFANAYFLPNAVSTLAKLKAHFCIALLTNGNSDPHKAGIAEYFDTVIMAEEFSFRKPDKQIFEVLFGRFGNCSPKSVLHVGDCLNDDVFGAMNAGARSVWYNPAKQINRTNINPDHEISDLAELPALLGL